LEHTVAGNAAASGDCQGLALAEANTCKGVVAHFQARDLTSQSAAFNLRRFRDSLPVEFSRRRS
jgi:hypothetical protein